MAKDLHEWMQRKPDLFKAMIRTPKITKKVLAIVTALGTWGDRKGLEVKDLKIKGPNGAPEGFDCSFQLGRKHAS